MPTVTYSASGSLVHLCGGHMTPGREVKPVPTTPVCVCLGESSGRGGQLPEELRMMGLLCCLNRH